MFGVAIDLFGNLSKDGAVNCNGRLVIETGLFTIGNFNSFGELGRGRRDLGRRIHEQNRSEKRINETVRRMTGARP